MTAASRRSSGPSGTSRRRSSARTSTSSPIPHEFRAHVDGGRGLDVAVHHGGSGRAERHDARRVSLHGVGFRRLPRLRRRQRRQQGLLREDRHRAGLTVRPGHSRGDALCDRRGAADEHEDRHAAALRPGEPRAELSLQRQGPEPPRVLSLRLHHRPLRGADPRRRRRPLGRRPRQQFLRAGADLQPRWHPRRRRKPRRRRLDGLRLLQARPRRHRHRRPARAEDHRRDRRARHRRSDERGGAVPLRVRDRRGGPQGRRRDLPRAGHGRSRRTRRDR